MIRRIPWLLLLLFVSAGCARTRQFDGQRWEVVRLYEGPERPEEALAAVVAGQPLYVIAVGEEEVDDIAAVDRMVELLPGDHIIQVGYRTHNAMNETVLAGKSVSLKFKAKTNRFYRVVLLEEIEDELDDEYEWAGGIRDETTMEIVSVPVLQQVDAKSAAEETKRRLEAMKSGLRLEIVTNENGRVEFRVPKRK
jgi:hypothetical protein